MSNLRCVTFNNKYPAISQESWFNRCLSVAKNVPTWPIRDDNIIHPFYYNFVRHFAHNPQYFDDYFLFIYTIDQTSTWPVFCELAGGKEIFASKEWSYNLNVDSEEPRLKWSIRQFNQNDLQRWMERRIDIPDFFKQKGVKYDF